MAAKTQAQEIATLLNIFKRSNDPYQIRNFYEDRYPSYQRDFSKLARLFDVAAQPLETAEQFCRQDQLDPVDQAKKPPYISVSDTAIHINAEALASTVRHTVAAGLDMSASDGKNYATHMPQPLDQDFKDLLLNLASEAAKSYVNENNRVTTNGANARSFIASIAVVAYGRYLDARDDHQPTQP